MKPTPTKEERRKRAVAAFQAKLRALGACSKGLRFARGKTVTEAWRACTNPWFMAWWLHYLDHHQAREIARDVSSCWVEVTGLRQTEINKEICDRIRKVVKQPWKPPRRKANG